MKRILISILSVCAIISANAFVLNVKNIPEELKGRPLWVVSQLDKSTIDSTMISGPSATFQGEVDAATLCMLNYSYPIDGGVITNYVPIFLDKDSAEITFIDYHKRMLTNSGSALNDEYQNIMSYLQASMPFTRESFSEAVDYLAEKAKKNSSNPLGVYLLMYISSSYDTDKWFELYNGLSSEMAKYPGVKASAEKLKAELATQGGAKIENLDCLTPDGEKVCLYDYIGKGKYVLIDFWAKWCGPCRKEAKDTLTPLYEKYKDNDNFMILGIMTSDSVESHKEGLSRIHYPWQQIIDADNVASKTYGFNFIPQIMLIAPDGTLIARDLRGDAITELVDKSLAK